MKNLMMFLILIFLLVAAQISKAETADEIVERYLEALGGKQKLLSLSTVKMEGMLSVQGIEVALTITAKQQIGMRTDIAVPGMGEGYQIMNTTKGWSFMPFQGQTEPTEVTAEEFNNGQSSLDIQGSLLNYKEKGSIIEVIGKENVDGAPCHKLKITTKSGKMSIYFIDANTYLRVKAISITAEKESETTYSDFRKNADGFMYPYSQTNERGTIIFTSIETNKAVEDKIFTID